MDTSRRGPMQPAPVCPNPWGPRPNPWPPCPPPCPPRPASPGTALVTSSLSSTLHCCFVPAASCQSRIALPLRITPSDHTVRHPFLSSHTPNIPPECVPVETRPPCPATPPRCPPPAHWGAQDDCPVHQTYR